VKIGTYVEDDSENCRMNCKLYDDDDNDSFLF